MKNTAQQKASHLRAFTLLELLIVMAMVTVLITLAVSGVSTLYKYTARENAATEFLNELLETKTLAESNVLQSSLQRPPLKYTFNFTATTFNAQACQVDSNYTNPTNCISNITLIKPSGTFAGQNLTISSKSCTGINFYGTKDRFEIIPINGNTVDSPCYICLSSGTDFVRVVFINPPRKRIDIVSTYTTCP